jgi:hypothetical protein
VNSEQVSQELKALIEKGIYSPSIKFILGIVSASIDEGDEHNLAEHMTVYAMARMEVLSEQSIS